MLIYIINFFLQFLGCILSFVDSHKLLSSPIHFTLIILRVQMSPIQLVLIISPVSIILKLSGKHLTLTPRIILSSLIWSNNKREMAPINMTCYILTN
jgi:hypothetical protein